MRRFLAFFTMALVCAALFAPAAVAAEADPDISMEKLKLELRPLFQDKIEPILDAWMTLLQQNVQAASNTRLALVDASEEQKADLRKQLADLVSAREGILARVNYVLADFEAKGGKPVWQRNYLAAIGDTQEDEIEAKGWSGVILDWITSPDGGIKWAKQIGFFLLILFAFRIVANIVGSIVRRSLDAMGRTPELLRNFLANTTRNVIFFIGLVVALSQLGMDIGPMLAAIGGAGFVIGFALQSTLSNFAAGVMILLYRPYEIGDVVTVSGTTGKVKAMTLVSTTVITPDNQVIVVPNSNIWGDVITNVTGSSTRRVDLVFGIGYDDDMDKAQGLLEEIARAHPKVLEEPATVVKVGTLNASSVDYVVRPWCKTEDYWDVYWDITRQVKERFDAEGVSIPYPQTDIHIHQASDPA